MDTEHPVADGPAASHITDHAFIPRPHGLRNGVMLRYWWDRCGVKRPDSKVCAMSEAAHAASTLERP